MRWTWIERRSDYSLGKGHDLGGNDVEFLVHVESEEEEKDIGDYDRLFMGGAYVSGSGADEYETGTHYEEEEIADAGEGSSSAKKNKNTFIMKKRK